jgi:uncharacterized coiled-coil protein SlyX
MPGQLDDESAIFDFSLANTDLELIRTTSAIAQVDVADMRKDRIETLALVGPGDVVAGVQGQAESRNARTQGDGLFGDFRDGAGEGGDREENPFGIGDLDQPGQALGFSLKGLFHLLVGFLSERIEGDQRDGGDAGQPADGLELAGVFSGILGAEVYGKGSGNQSGAMPQTGSCLMHILDHLGGAELSSVFVDGSLELGKLQLGDTLQGAFERLPSETKRRTSDEHGSLRFFPAGPSFSHQRWGLYSQAVYTACAVWKKPQCGRRKKVPGTFFAPAVGSCLLGLPFLKEVVVVSPSSLAWTDALESIERALNAILEQVVDLEAPPAGEPLQLGEQLEERLEPLRTCLMRAETQASELNQALTEQEQALDAWRQALSSLRERQPQIERPLTQDSTRTE